MCSQMGLIEQLYIELGLLQLQIIDGKFPLMENCTNCQLWQYGLWSFKTRDTNLEKILHKDQHTQKKLLNFENWTNGTTQ